MVQMLSAEPYVLPVCPEVCRDCESGKHVMHVMNELADLFVTEMPVDNNWPPGRIILKINGYAEDLLYLEDLIRLAARALPMIVFPEEK